MMTDFSYRGSLGACAATVIAALTTDASAQGRPQGRTIACEGPFGRSASHDDLIRTFGSANVVVQDVGGPEGEELKATIVYPNAPTARLEIVWDDERTQRG